MIRTVRAGILGFTVLVLGLALSGCGLIPDSLLVSGAAEPTANLAETMYWLVDDAQMRMSTQVMFEVDRRLETLAAGGAPISLTATEAAPVSAAITKPAFTVTSVADAIRTKQAAEARGISLPSAAADCENKMDFIADVTIPDHAIVSAGKPFTKTWQVRNTGTCDWTEAYAIVFEMGDPMSAEEWTHLPKGTVVKPNETIDLSVYMTAPEKPGAYAAYWKLEDGNGNRFGTGSDYTKSLWVKVEVK